MSTQRYRRPSGLSGGAGGSFDVSLERQKHAHKARTIIDIINGKNRQTARNGREECSVIAEVMRRLRSTDIQMSELAIAGSSEMAAFCASVVRDSEQWGDD